MANEIIQETSHLKLARVDKLAMWDSLFRAEQSRKILNLQKLQPQNPMTWFSWVLQLRLPKTCLKCQETR